MIDLADLSVLRELCEILSLDEHKPNTSLHVRQDLHGEDCLWARSEGAIALQGCELEELHAWTHPQFGYADCCSTCLGSTT